MKILSIETSCDETAVAILDIDGPLENPDIKILGNTLLSQIALHEQYGGVYPTLAKREHIKNLPILLEQTVKEAHLETRFPSIDLIAVTSGPGLEPALWVGITFAEELGRKWQKPVIPINHMEGHIWSVLFEEGKLELPAIALLVSGGHTELVYIKDFGEYEILGQTRDDAVGEAFDKVARMLGLPYPGGPQISKLAERSRVSTRQVDTLRLPRPMIHSGDLDFSYSGLKTAVLYKLKESLDIDKEDMARAFEDAAIEVLVEKTRKAITERPEIKTLIVGGGVSANIHLKRELEKMVSQFPEVTLRLPSRLLSTDNALMIGLAAYIKVKKNPEILNPPAGGQTPIKAEGNAKLG